MSWLGPPEIRKAVVLPILAPLLLVGMAVNPSLPVTIIYPAFWSAWSYTVPGLGKPDLFIGYMAIAGAAIRVFVKHEPLPKLPRHIVIGVSILLGTLVVCWLLNQSFSQGLAYFVSLSSRILLMYLVFLHIRNSSQLRIAVIIYVASAIIIGCLVFYLSLTYGFGFVRVFGVSDQIQANIGEFWYKVAISFSFGGAPALLLFGLFSRVRARRQKLFVVFMTLFLFWMVFSAEYRREILLSFAVLFLYLSVTPTAAVRRPAIALLVLASFLFVVALLPNSPVLQERLGRETAMARAGDELREVSFRAGMSAFLESPLLGSGPGSYEQVVTPRVEPKYYLAYNLHRVPPFNVFVWVAVEGGLFALVGYGLILFGVYQTSRSAARVATGGVEGWVLRCAPVLLLQIILWSNFGNAWDVSMPWFLMGLILAAARLARQPSLEHDEAELIGEV